MDLPTYTSIWRIEKRLYRLYDFKLPIPVGMRTFGVGFAIFVCWVVLLNLLGVPFTRNGWLLVLWVVPPGMLTIACTRPIHEGKRLPELAWSYAKYFYQGRVYVRGRRHHSPGLIRVRAQVWTLPGTLPAPPTPRHKGPDPIPLTTRRPDTVSGAVRHSARPLPAHRPPSPTPKPKPAPAPEPVVEPAQKSTPAPVLVAHPQQHRPASAVLAEPTTDPAQLSGSTALLIMVMGCAEDSGQTSTARALAHSIPTGHGPAAVITFTTTHTGAPILTSTTTEETEQAPNGPVALTLALAEDARGRDVAAHLAPILHRYPVVIVDPPGATLAPLLSLTDQLVVCATNNNAGAREMILCTEWLRSAGHEALAEQALAVLTPTTPHRAEAMLSATNTGMREVYTPVWDEQVRTHQPPTTSATTYRDLAEQALHTPAHL